MKKVFFYDLGLRNMVYNSFNELEFRTDKGAIFENEVMYGPQNKPYNIIWHNFARKLPEKQRVILNFAGWAGQNKLYQNLYFGLIFDGRGARFL